MKKLLLALSLPLLLLTGCDTDSMTPVEFCYHEVSAHYGEYIPYSYKEINNVQSQKEDAPHLYYYDYKITVYDDDEMDVWVCSVCFYSDQGEQIRYKFYDCRWLYCDLAYTVDYSPEVK